MERQTEAAPPAVTAEIHYAPGGPDLAECLRAVLAAHLPDGGGEGKGVAP